MVVVFNMPISLLCDYQIDLGQLVQDGLGVSYAKDGVAELGTKTGQHARLQQKILNFTLLPHKNLVDQIIDELTIALGPTRLPCIETRQHQGCRPTVATLDQIAFFPDCEFGITK